MLHDARIKLTEAVVIGPGRAVLFYGRHSMGEGLTIDEARDATFLLTEAGMWIGKSAYLTTDPMTIQEGRWAIAQTITDHWGKARRLGCPHVNLLVQKPSGLTPQEAPLGRMQLEMVAPIINHHLISPQEAKNAIDVGETKGLHHLGSPHIPWIMGSRVTWVHYQQLPWCHLCVTGQTDHNIPDEGDGTKKMELTWR